MTQSRQQPKGQGHEAWERSPSAHRERPNFPGRQVEIQASAGDFGFCDLPSKEVGLECMFDGEVQMQGACRCFTLDLDYARLNCAVGFHSEGG